MGFLDTMEDAFTKPVDWAEEAWEGTEKKVLDPVGNAFDDVGDWFKDAWEETEEIFGDALGWTKDLIMLWAILFPVGAIIGFNVLLRI